MINVKQIIVENFDGSTTTHIIEEFAPNEFRSMLKSTWDELEAQKEAELGGTL